MNGHKPVTRDLIRKHFGKSARISGFCGHYRVKTRTGGEVEISSRKMKIIFGGDDTYKAVTLLGGEMWGSIEVTGGSREFTLASLAHGEAWGVPVHADYSDKGAAFFRVVVFLLILGFGLHMGADKDTTTLLVTVGGAVVMFAALKRSARQKEQAKAEAMGFNYPRVQGNARFSDDEDLEKGGLI